MGKAHRPLRGAALAGVAACITPWNYPLHQITGKVAPALLAGCTVVLKPSELAPSSAFLPAQAVAQAGLPLGVFNLVHGSGPEVGEALVGHPEVDLGVLHRLHPRRAAHRGCGGTGHQAAGAGAGGKSAAVVLPGADLAAAVKATLGSCFLNSGQTCSATTRLLVPREQAQQAAHLAAELAPSWRMGDPADPATRLGPLISAAQREKVRALVDAALAEGAELATRDGPLPPHGFFFPPTVLHQVTPGMAIAREEVFGPVLVILPYDSIDDAVAIANGTDYGLAATVWGATPAAALPVAQRLRAGQVDINGAPFQSAGALRRLQALRHRPRERPLRHRGIPRAALPATASQLFRHAMNYQQIQSTLDGATAVITLNRPERMNALTKVLEAELRDAIEQAGRNPESVPSC